jgi:hypothetical protein
MSLVDAVRVGGRVFPPPPVELAAYQTCVYVTRRFESDGATPVGRVEVEDGAVYCVEVGTPRAALVVVVVVVVVVPGG